VRPWDCRVSLSEGGDTSATFEDDGAEVGLFMRSVVGGGSLFGGMSTLRSYLRFCLLFSLFFIVYIYNSKQYHQTLSASFHASDSTLECLIFFGLFFWMLRKSPDKN